PRQRPCIRSTPAAYFPTAKSSPIYILPSIPQTAIKYLYRISVVIISINSNPMRSKPTMRRTKPIKCSQVLDHDISPSLLINSLSISSMSLAELWMFTISMKRAKLLIMCNKSRRTIVPAIVAVRKFVFRQTESFCMRAIAQKQTVFLCLAALSYAFISYYTLFPQDGDHHPISILVQTVHRSSLQIINPPIFAFFRKIPNADYLHFRA